MKVINYHSQDYPLDMLLENLGYSIKDVKGYPDNLKKRVNDYLHAKADQKFYLEVGNYKIELQGADEVFGTLTRLL